MTHPLTVSEGFHLSAQQERALDAERALGRRLLAVGSRRFDAVLDVERLRGALDRLSERHEILRTTYQDVAGLDRPLQVVLPAANYQIEVAERPILEPLAAARTALAGGERVLGVLLARDGSGSVLHVAGRSASFDEESLTALLAEISLEYAGDGTPKGEGLEYLDYAEWQHDLRASDWGQEGARFWSTAVAPGALERRLPFEAERAPDLSHRRCAVVSVQPALERLAAELGAPPSSVLFFLWAAFGARITQREDVLSGYVAGKTNANLSDTLGRFASSLPVSCRLDRALSVRDNFAAVHARLEECLAWQDAFRASDVRVVSSAKMASYPFGFAVRVQRSPGTNVSSEDPDLERLRLEYDEANGRLTLAYLPSSFDADVVEVWACQLATFIGGCAAAVSAPLAQVGLLGAEERRTLLEVFAGRPSSALLESSPRLLHELFEAQVALDPARPAVSDRSGVIDYAELDRRAECVASYLRAAGLRREEVIGVYADRSIELIVALLGILKAGGAYLPLDPSYPSGHLSNMLLDAHATRVLVHSGSGAPRELGEDVALIPLAQDAPVWRATPGRRSERPRQEPGQLAYLIYTSGSTGRPKGVMVSHGNAVSSTLARHEFYDWKLDNFLLLSSVSFDSSVAGIFWTLSHGGCLCLPAEGDQRDARLVLELIRERQVTHLLTLPSFYEQLLPELGGTTVRGVIVAGEACPPGLVRRHFEMLPGADLVNEYGPTEGSVWSTASRLRPDHEGPVTIGGPIATMQAYVLDARLEPVPIGVEGELFIGGWGITRGYFERSSLTAERFVPHPFGRRGERLYRTGDAVRWRPDGTLDFLGRVDHQVKIRGYRIELGEIEAKLRDHADVAEVAVLAREDAPGIKRLVGYIVPRDPTPQNLGSAALLESLRAHLAQRVPDFMVPAQFVALARFPQTPNGKLDRAALPAPTAVRVASSEPPRTDLERRLAAVWSDVLHVESIGVHDDFFQLGGDSIILLQVVAQARQRGLEFSARDMFRHPTLERLAGFITEGAAAALASAASADASDADAPLGGAQRWLLAVSSEPDRAAEWLWLEANAEVDLGALERSLRALVRRHSALRQRVSNGRSRLLPASALDDLWSVAPIATAAELGADAAPDAAVATARGRLSLAEGRLLAAVLVRRVGAPDRILLAAHRFAVARASWHTVLGELDRAYRGQALEDHLEDGRARGDEPEVSALELAYHRDAVADQRPDALPKDAAADAAPGQSSVSRVLDADTCARLVAAASALRADLDELLLTAFARVLCRWTRKSSVSLTVEPAGTRGGVGGPAAPYILNLRPELNGARAGAASVRAVKERWRSVPQGGAGYVALRYPSQSADASEFGEVPWPRVVWAPLGVDAPLDVGSAAFRVTQGPRSSGVPAAWLSLGASRLGQRLEVVFGAALEHLKPETLEQLADDYGRELAVLVAQAADHPDAAVAPSDFPLARLEPRELSRLELDWSGVEDLYALSPMQQGMLLHTLLEPGSGIYLMQDHYSIDSHIDPVLLERAWREVAARHPALRTCFLWEDDRMLQQVRRAAAVSLDYLDYRELPAETWRERLSELLRQEREAGFDMRRAPLWKLRLVRVADARFELTISHHHILVDGWSWGQIWLEVCSYYQAAISGTTAELPAIAPYRDFIAWLDARDLDVSVRYWKDVLVGFDQATPLPVDRPIAPPDSVSKIASLRVTLSELESAQIQALTSRHGITTNTLLQAAWALTLGRYSGQRDVLFGVTVAGRPVELPELQQTVGLFINTIPLRVALPGPNTRVRDWLQALLEQNVEMRQHEHLPLVRVQALSAIGRSEPLFHSLFVYENVPIDSSILPHAQNLRVRAGDSRVHTNYPLTVMILPAQRLGLDLSYDERLFEPSTVAALLDEFERSIRALVERFDEPVRRFSASCAQPSAALLECGVGQRRLYAWDTGYSALFEARARRDPERVAATSGDARWTYAELARNADAVGRALIDAGLPLEGCVAVLCERGLPLLAAALGALKVGGVYVPLDPSQPPERLARASALSGARAVLCAPSRRVAVERWVEGTAAGTRPAVLDLAEVLSAPAGAPAPIRYAGPRSLAYLIFTSGSTGEPKGAMVEHGGMLNNVLSKEHDLSLAPTDVIAQTASQAFDISVWQLLTGPVCGVCVDIIPDAVAHEPRALSSHVAQRGVTVIESVPSLIAALLLEAPDGFARLRVMITTGEATPPELARRWLKIHPHVLLVNAYGPAECADDVALDILREPPPAHVQNLPIGRATDNNRLYVLDAALERVPFGATGEICIAGIGPGRGYVGDSRLTALKFVPNPHAEVPGERLYRTGDLARFRADGSLEFLGRIDHQVKIRGFRIELGEIEARLLEHAAIREAAVFARESPGGKRLVGYVAPHEGQQANPVELREHLARTLPHYMVPAQVVVLERLPLSSNGKLDRRALPEPEAAHGNHVEPTSELGRGIARIWSEVLGVERVGLTDNFFALGGHSLLATQIVARIHAELGIIAPLRALFATDTLQAFEQSLPERSRAR